MMGKARWRKGAQGAQFSRIIKLIMQDIKFRFFCVANRTYTRLL